MKLIDSALIKLGIGIKDGEKTSPKEMLEFMHKIGLDIEDILAKTGSSLLKRLVTEEISLDPLKDRILIGIANNPPMAQSFIEIAKSRELINATNITKEQKSYFIYFLVVLEVLTTLMVNDRKFQKIIVISLLKKRNSVNYGSSFWNFWKLFTSTKGDLFRSLKTISVDPVIFADLCWRKYAPDPSEDDLSCFIKKEKLSGLNSSFLKNLLNLQKKEIKHYGILCGNIFEALITEEIIINRKKHDLYKSTSNSNIKSGIALIIYHELFQEKFSPLRYVLFHAKPQTYKESKSNFNDFWNDLYNFSTEQNHVQNIKGITQEWINLYESWNLVFVLKYFSKASCFFLPKLLIPQTLSSVPENYFASRPISLWLSINFVSNLRRNKFNIKFEPVDNTFLVECLSKNNLEYAHKLLKSEKIDLDYYYKNHIQSKSTWRLYFKALQMLRGAKLIPNKAHNRLQ